MQKLLSFFQQKNFSVFGYKVIKHLTTWPLNELVKLTLLWTMGPSYIYWLTLIAGRFNRLCSFSKPFSICTELQVQFSHGNGWLLIMFSDRWWRDVPFVEDKNGKNKKDFDHYWNVCSWQLWKCLALLWEWNVAVGDGPVVKFVWKYNKTNRSIKNP